MFQRIVISILRYNEAETILMQTLQIEKGIFGESHTNIAQTLNAIGVVKLEKGAFDDAFTFFSSVPNLLGV